MIHKCNEYLKKHKDDCPLKDYEKIRIENGLRRKSNKSIKALCQEEWQNLSMYNQTIFTQLSDISQKEEFMNNLNKS